ncbi:MAG: hypothetical protein CL902_01125 [Dehalococcoidia bacterium]|nr:hypothetical protein [Dehalococcoidia bacterium]|tara:strand:- start:84 stop:401 length:318 start_codon:yes stop_codon:yes gene_type:complete
MSDSKPEAPPAKRTSRKKIESEIRQDVEAALRNELADEVRAALFRSLEPEVRKQLYTDLKENVEKEIHEELHPVVMAALRLELSMHRSDSAPTQSSAPRKRNACR